VANYGDNEARTLALATPVGQHLANLTAAEIGARPLGPELAPWLCSPGTTGPIRLPAGVVQW
jgi:hypothetical protein